MIGRSPFLQILRDFADYGAAKMAHQIARLARRDRDA
jgi:hypothetical protein